MDPMTLNEIQTTAESVRFAIGDILKKATSDDFKDRFVDELAILAQIDDMLESITEESEPQFKDPYDDQEGYTFLGRFQNHDLYHAEFEQELTIISRFGNDPGDYGSGMVFGWLDPKEHPQCLPLIEARKRAQGLGLNVEKDKYQKLGPNPTYPY
ncbi:hypothetical protein CMI47_11045 [Candidatus Pacearchaeota archaeon]|nr:hypothetical protein [Candidatus Pacearchaeota archaeon]|tara:strand:+ start:40 stop:504 length:465 start_codon:yes stop_codon:yes gene_type:complete